MPKKFFILSTTEGCATNLLENTGYRGHYLGQGYQEAAGPGDADLILINTCGYSGAMEKRAVGTIADFQKKYVGKEIVVAGCLPRINPKGLKAVFDGEIVEPGRQSIDFAQSNRFDERDFAELSLNHRFVLRLRKPYFALENLLGVRFQPLHNIFRSVVVNQDYFLITVSTGCLGRCTFCAIRRAKGGLRSRPPEVILSELHAGLATGNRSFWLLGDDVGCWGLDRGQELPDLLESILAVKENFSLVLNYLDPHYLVRYGKRLAALLGDSRVECVNIPIQTGSQRLLETMGRDYDLRGVFHWMGEIKRMNPGLAIKSNIMVGFPGERWSDFWKSFFAVVKFDANLAIGYSPRPNTPAARFEGRVSPAVRNGRILVINAFILLWNFKVALGSLLQPQMKGVRSGRFARA